MVCGLVLSVLPRLLALLLDGFALAPYFDLLAPLPSGPGMITGRGRPPGLNRVSRDPSWKGAAKNIFVLKKLFYSFMEDFRSI